MKKMIWIKKQFDNPEVTNYYLEVIAEAYKKIGEDVNFFNDWNECNIKKSDIVVVSNHREAFKMALEKRNYVYWVQGIIPEEDYAKFNKKWRKFVLEQIERICLKKAMFIIFVSERMRKHYENKYGFKGSNYYIMPCSNDVIHKENFYYNGKYENNIFCYAGGLDVWQCFEETLQMYKKMESKYNNVSLLLLVKDKKLAQKLVQKYQIQNYEIDFVPVEDVPKKLASVKFGFLIRDDLELNRVATPTKLMTYVGNGVIPILSECLEGLIENINCTDYFVSVDKDRKIDNIEKILNMKIDPNEIYKQFENVYNKKYNRDAHISGLVKMIPRNETK